MQVPFNIRENVNQLFPTPLGTFNYPNAREVMPKIAEVILAKERADEGIRRSNKGGWHSDDTLLTWPELQFADLADTFRSATAHMITLMSKESRFNADLAIGAWANINRAGQFNSPHIHPNNHWSGVLYVKSPDFSVDPLPNAGRIEFQDPRGPCGMLPHPGMKNTLSLGPREGTMLLFPSWLYHWVNTFTIDVLRISIAFNVKINNFEALK